MPVCSLKSYDTPRAYLALLKNTFLDIGNREDPDLILRNGLRRVGAMRPIVAVDDVESTRSLYVVPAAAIAGRQGGSGVALAALRRVLRNTPAGDPCHIAASGTRHHDACKAVAPWHVMRLRDAVSFVPASWCDGEQRRLCG